MSRETISRARKLLAEGRFLESLSLYEAHLASHDGDDEIRLEMGLARLVSGDEEGFLRTGREYFPCMTPEVVRGLGHRTRSLWGEYVRSGARLAASAALGASVALCATGCRDRKEPAKPPVEVVEVEEPPDVPPVAAEDVTADEAPSDAGAEPPVKKPPKKPPRDFPKNRYVAVHFDDPSEKL